MSTVQKNWLVVLVCLSVGACALPPRHKPPRLPPPQSSGQADFDAELARGDAAWRSGRSDDALYAYLRAQQLEPTSDVPWLRVAALHESLGHPDLALRAWQMAALRNERNGLTRERLGYAWLQQGELGRAEVEFTRTLQLDAKAWRAAMGLGLVAERRLDVATARLRYDQALVLQQQDAELLTSSARVALEQGDTARAANELAAALSLGPRAETWLVLGDLIARQGDYPGGLEAYLKHLAPHEAYQRLGEQALRLGDYARAVWYFERAAVASPIWFERAHKSLVVARERWMEQQRRVQGAPHQ